MNLFKNKENNDERIPSDPANRKGIVEGILEGLSKTVRYTRMDDPATAYQITEHVQIIKSTDDSAIDYNLSDRSKIMVVRAYKNGEKDITPLDIHMLGKTYVTADGKPLGERAQVSLSHIETRANQIENNGVPSTASPYIRGIAEPVRTTPGARNQPAPSPCP